MQSELSAELVERVARKMLAESRPTVNPDDLTPAPRGRLGLVPKWTLYAPLARAALLALRPGDVIGGLVLAPMDPDKALKEAFHLLGTR